MLILLAQSEPQLSRLFIPGIAIIILSLLALVLVLQVKKQMNARDDDGQMPAGFTLSDLRTLHKAGQMSDEEFERAKGKIITAAQRASARESAVASEGGVQPARNKGRSGPSRGDLGIGDLEHKRGGHGFEVVRPGAGGRDGPGGVDRSGRRRSVERGEWFGRTSRRRGRERPERSRRAMTIGFTLSE